MASNLKYKYAPLSSDRTIRLLRLMPGSPSSPLVCYLDEASLDDPELEYKALSYVWGDEYPQLALWIEGIGRQELLIRSNLDAALRQLRKNILSCCDPLCVCQNHLFSDQGTVLDQFTFPVYLWIDAICINQGSKEERARQIPLMGEIYKKAHTVVAWLGEEDDYTVPAIQLLLGLSNLWDWWADEAKVALRHLTHNEKFKNFWIALGHFFARSWWTRVWIIQEIVLSRNTIFICGRWCTTWDRISKATPVLMDDSADELSEATTFTGEFLYLHVARRGIGLLKFLKIIKMALDNPETWCPSPEKDVLSTLLHAGRRYNATDPRDKVYGVLGLLSGFGVNPQLSVNYDRSVCDVYMSTAELMYKQQGNLDFLSLVEVNRSIDEKRKFNLPSWAPDHTVPTNYLSIFSDMRYAPKWVNEAKVSRELSGTFAFTGNLESCCIFNLGSKTIKVTGFEVDIIQRIETRLIDLQPNFRANHAVRYGRRLCWHPPNKTEESKLEEIWDGFLDHEHAHTRAWGQVENVVAECGPVPCYRPKCFQTATLQLCGVTDAYLCVNDRVCGLLGLKVPCILRFQENSWHFVGLWLVLRASQHCAFLNRCRKKCWLIFKLLVT